MKVDQQLQHAPGATSDSFNGKVCGALVHTLEFLFPPLKRSLTWDRSEFEPMFPVRLVSCVLRLVYGLWLASCALRRVRGWCV